MMRLAAMQLPAALWGKFEALKQQCQEPLRTPSIEIHSAVGEGRIVYTRAAINGPFLVMLKKLDETNLWAFFDRKFNLRRAYRDGLKVMHKEKDQKKAFDDVVCFLQDPKNDTK